MRGIFAYIRYTVSILIIFQVARMVLEMCYKALYNAMTRREHERNENRRMIEKQQRIESITLNMREQGATPEQLAEVSYLLIVFLSTNQSVYYNY